MTSSTTSNSNKVFSATAADDVQIGTTDTYKSRPGDRDEENTFTLPSGRILGYARYGAKQSPHPTTIYLHGYPSSRIEASLLAPDLHNAGLRLIAIDRPGFGLSTPDPSRSIMDHAHDVLALADHLELETFAVMGMSGGASYAYACSQVIPDTRLIGLGIVSGMGPWEMAMEKEAWRELSWLNKVGFAGPVYFPWVYSLIYTWLVKATKNDVNSKTYEQQLVSRRFTKLSERDKAFVLWGGEEVYQSTVKSIQEATRHEEWSRWHLQDAQLLGGKWDFELEDVKREVRLWYGEKDVTTPLVYGKNIAAKLSKGILTVVENGTHSSTLLEGARYVKELVGA